MVRHRNNSHLHYNMRAITGESLKMYLLQRSPEKTSAYN